MSNSDIRALARAYFEDAWVPGRNLEKYVAENVVRHSHGKPSAGIQSLRDLNKMFHDLFSQWELTLHDILCEGDKVAVRFTIMLTHTGEFMGFRASGARIQVNGIDMFRVAGGKIVEQWAEVDFFHFVEQLREHSGEPLATAGS
jgi:predicted ester cyclase